MKISILGLGYVGAVSAACLVRDGHEIVGVDPNPGKIGLINDGQSPIIEEDLDTMISEGVSAGRLRATTDTVEAICSTVMSMVCVGTPSEQNGSLDLRYVRRVCEQIGEALKQRNSRHVVVMRSTMLPGTMRDLVIPTLEAASGLNAGEDFGICNNPEFLREGTAVYDYYNPPKTVIGEIDSSSGDVLASIYRELDAPMIRTRIESAEMVKYCDNVWHALKVGFANEVGNICKEINIDSHAVMDIFCQDQKLNLSPYYLKPGFAFGGSCLPKDVRALTYKGRALDLDLPIMNAILPSNREQVDLGLKRIMAYGRRKISVLGISFKAGTDDLRESPLVEVVERLIGKGYDLRIYDRNVKMASLVGSNRDFILNHIPHIARLLEDDLDTVISYGDVVVIGNGDNEFRDVPDRLRVDQHVIDLVRVSADRRSGGNYDGFSW